MHWRFAHLTWSNSWGEVAFGISLIQIQSQLKSLKKRKAGRKQPPCMSMPTTKTYWYSKTELIHDECNNKLRTPVLGWRDADEKRSERVKLFFRSMWLYLVRVFRLKLVFRIYFFSHYLTSNSSNVMNTKWSRGHGQSMQLCLIFLRQRGLFKHIWGQSTLGKVSDQMNGRAQVCLHRTVVSWICIAALAYSCLKRELLIRLACGGM